MELATGMLLLCGRPTTACTLTQHVVRATSDDLIENVEISLTWSLVHHTGLQGEGQGWGGVGGWKMGDTKVRVEMTSTVKSMIDAHCKRSTAYTTCADDRDGACSARTTHLLQQVCEGREQNIISLSCDSHVTVM